jgi:uncharacterized protein YbjT (DUF2867 family)
MSVLLLGATGNVGQHVARALVARGVDTLALVRDPGRAAQRLPTELRLVQGDFRDAPAVRSALDGAEALFLLTPHGPDMGRDQLELVGIAADAGVRVVKLSGTSALIRPDGPDACRQHWTVEQALLENDVPHVVIRPNAFMQTLVAAMVAWARASGTIADPLGDVGISLVDCADIGAAVAEALVNTDCNGGIFALTGPAAPTYRDIAATIEAVGGRSVKVVDVTPEQAGKAVLARGRTPWDAEHLSDMLTEFRTGVSAKVTGDVFALTGRRPRTVEDYVRSTSPELFA